MDSLFFRAILKWTPIAVSITTIVFIIYLVIQQDIRIGANAPQIQMAEDTASELNSGQSLTPSGKIDIANSLAPFTILYDKSGNVISSSAILEGKTPNLPRGVLTSSKDTNLKGENRITWQPETGVRLASVIVAYKNGYVLVGRNMREIEIRESQQFTNIQLGWIVSLVATFFSVVATEIISKKNE